MSNGPPHARRAGIALALLLIAGLVAVGVARREAEPTIPSAPSISPAPGPTAAVPRARASRPRPLPAVQPDLPAPSVVAAITRLGEATGDGLIRCDLGPGVRSGQVGGLPGFSERHGDSLIAAVPFAEGEVVLVRQNLVPWKTDMTMEDYERVFADADSPERHIGIARWEGAYAGTWGACVVERLTPEQLTERFGAGWEAADGPRQADFAYDTQKAEVFATAVELAAGSGNPPEVRAHLEGWAARARDHHEQSLRMEWAAGELMLILEEEAR